MGNDIHTQSGDLGLHYGFAKDISENWHWPVGDKPWTKGMGAYPPFSHYLAAYGGIFTGSTFSAMHYVGILSVFICYNILFSRLVSQEITQTFLALGLASFLVLLAATQSAVIGFEVFRNFFYAQVVGQVAFLGYAHILSGRPAASYGTLAYAVVATFISGWIYPITSILIAFAYMAFESVIILKARLRGARVSSGSFVRAALAILILPAAIGFHPTFRHMNQIASTNGALDFGIFTYLTPLVALGLICFCVALAIFCPQAAQWRRAEMFFVTTGLSAGGAALAQYFAYETFGAGSEYAVRKHLLVLLTLSICTMAWAFSAVISKIKFPWPRKKRLGKIVAIVPAVVCVVVVFNLPHTPAESLSSFLEYQAFIEKESSQLPRDAQGQTSSRNSRFGWYLNYAITLANLKMDTFEASDWMQTEFNSSKPWPEKYSFLVDHGEFPDGCASGPSNPFDVILANIACIRRRAPSLEVDKLIDLTAWRESPSYMTQGWSIFDGVGVWSVGGKSTIIFRLSYLLNSEFVFALRAAAFLPSPNAVSRVVVSFDGAKETYAIDYTAANNNQEKLIPIPPQAIGANGDVRINFNYLNAASPKTAGISDDDRELGLHVSKIGVLSAYRPYQLGKLVRIGPRGGLDWMTEGWSGAEPQGVWTDGPTAVMKLALDKLPTTALKLHVKANAYLPTIESSQMVRVTANDVLIAEWRFDTPNLLVAREAEIPLTALRGKNLKIALTVSDATSPSSLGRSTDSRLLGLFLEEFSIAPTAGNYALGTKLLLSDATEKPEIFGEGWSIPEPDGIWTDGFDASLILHLSHLPKQNLVLSVDATAFLPRSNATQHVLIDVEGMPVAEWVFDNRSPSGRRQAVISINSLTSPNLQIHFSLPGATRPADSGSSPDRRRLGIMVRSFQVTGID